MTPARLAALLAALVLAGCVDGAPLGLGGGGAALQPYVEEHADVVGAQYARAFPLEVRAGATRIDAALDLAMRTGGLASSPATPARLHVQIVGPTGEVLAAGDATSEKPSLRIAAEGLAPGAYEARVSGFGFSAALAGANVGASYLLVLEVR